jgi:hypothetical protein
MLRDLNDIDKLAREALQNFEMDYNPEDWKLLEQRLDKKDHRKPKIILYKSIEAFLLLVLLLTAANFLFNSTQTVLAEENIDKANAEKLLNYNQSNDGNLNNTQNGRALAMADNSTVKEKVVKKINESKVKSKEAKSYLVSNKNTNQNETNHLTLSKSKNTTVNNYIKGKDEKLNQSSDNLKSSDNGNSNSKSISNSISNLNPAELDSKNETVNIVTTDNEDSKSTLSESIFNASDFKIFLPKADLENIPYADSKRGASDIENLKALEYKPKFNLPKFYHRQTRLVIFGGADYNFKNTIGNNHIGFSTGLMMENEISRRIYIRSGLIYSSKSFEKQYDYIIDRRADVGLIYLCKVDQKTNISVLSFPLQLNTIFFKDKKWKLSANLGASVSLLVGRTVNGTQRTNMGSVTALTDLNASNFERGLFQKGNADNNIFFNLLGGFDIERQLSDRVNIFAQPLYNFGLTKVGESKDRLQNISLNVGLKIIIK